MLRHAGDEGLVLINFRPRAFVDPEVMQACLTERSLVLLELLVKRQIAAPELLHEKVIHHLRCLNQLDESLLVTG
jgi:hypothetical protein